MRFKTNMVFDKPNHNGRIYKEDMFKKALTNALNSSVLIYENSESACNSRDLNNTIGMIDGFEVKDKNLFLKGALFDSPQNIMAKQLLESGMAKLTMAGYGEVKEGVIENYSVYGTFLVDNDNNGI